MLDQQKMFKNFFAVLAGVYLWILTVFSLALVKVYLGNFSLQALPVIGILILVYYPFYRFYTLFGVMNDFEGFLNFMDAKNKVLLTSSLLVIVAISGAQSQNPVLKFMNLPYQSLNTFLNPGRVVLEQSVNKIFGDATYEVIRIHLQSFWSYFLADTGYKQVSKLFIKE